MRDKLYWVGGGRVGSLHFGCGGVGSLQARYGGGRVWWVYGGGIMMVGHLLYVPTSKLYAGFPAESRNLENLEI